MKQIINRKLYNTATATRLTSDHYWDGSNWQRHGRNTYPYRTKKGNYFLLHTTMWQGERDHLEAITPDEALARYEQLPEHEIDFAEAFPGVTLEDA